MGWMQKVENKNWRVFWRDPAGAQRSKTLTTKEDADSFLAETETAKSRGLYVSPHAGRTTFVDHAAAWMASWNTEQTTAARDRSLMRTHVLRSGDFGSSARSTTCRCSPGSPNSSVSARERRLPRHTGSPRPCCAPRCGTG